MLNSSTLILPLPSPAFSVLLLKLVPIFFSIDIFTLHFQDAPSLHSWLYIVTLNSSPDCGKVCSTVNYNAIWYPGGEFLEFCFLPVCQSLFDASKKNCLEARIIS